MRQELIFDKALNAVKTTIKKPFFYASENLGWGWKSQGLGFNMDIIDKCLNMQADLIVYIEETGYTYRIKFKQLEQFLQTFNCDWYVKRGKFRLKVISFDWFEAVEN